LNVVRGILAEFLVAAALGIDDDAPRIGFANYDLLYEGPTTIEVKSTARWQSWEQHQASNLRFDNLRRQRWDEVTKSRRTEREVIADVYIFALHDCETPSDYQPLATEQWSFFVLSGQAVRELGQDSISASRLAELTARLTFGELKAAFEELVTG
jgi:hypothetical protein